jgi:hypothetical protein
MGRWGQWLSGAIVFAVIALGFSRSSSEDALPEAKHFMHGEHAAKGVPVDKCDTCHHIDAKGQLLVPAAQGHSPCLEAKCHASYFLAVGEKAKKADPVAFAKAAPFCLGCHDNVPWPWKKPATKTLHSFQYEREHHVEMPHYLHTQMTVPSTNAKLQCRDCHAVDTASFSLVVNAPGHAQCVLCHNAKDYPKHTMAMCGQCHSAPARAEYFNGSRPQNTVRACESEGLVLLKNKFLTEKPKIPGGPKAQCFRHERVEHRFRDKATMKDPIQCNNCHYMIDDNTKWRGQKYESLKDLHSARIISNASVNEDQHKACGAKGCHDSAVGNGPFEPKCGLCHAEISGF